MLYVVGFLGTYIAKICFWSRCQKLNELAYNLGG